MLALVERGGNVRTFHVAGTTTGELVPIVRANIQAETFSDRRASFLSGAESRRSLASGLNSCAIWQSRKPIS